LITTSNTKFVYILKLSKTNPEYIVILAWMSNISSFQWLAAGQWVSLGISFYFIVRRVWRYERGNQSPYIEEDQTTQWPKEKVQKDKQQSTKHTHKTKDRVTRTPLKTGSELRCSGMVGSSWSTSGTRRVNLVVNPLIFMIFT
jgi:hypothetical protein